MNLWDNPPPPGYKRIPNMCIDIVNIMWEWGVVSKGKRMLQRQKKNQNENVIIWLRLCYWNNCVLRQFLIALKTDKFLSFFLIWIYCCKKSRYVNIYCEMYIWFTGVRECPPWCSIVGATVTVHQFFCTLHVQCTQTRKIASECGA